MSEPKPTYNIRQIADSTDHFRGVTNMATRCPNCGGMTYKPGPDGLCFDCGVRKDRLDAEQLLNVQQLPAVFWDNTQDGYPLPGDIEIDADNGGNALIEIHQPGRGLYVVFNEGDLEILLAKIRNA